MKSARPRAANPQKFVSGALLIVGYAPSVSTTAAPPQAALELQEAVAAKPTPLGDDGTVTIHIIRPGIGGGRGRHYYGPEMLQENASKFNGWRVYVDHLSPEAKKALGGLPRSMKDLGGMIEESWWDGTVPGDNRFEAGAVVGKMRPIRDLKDVVEQLPQAVQFSIKAKATDVRPEIMEGSEAWVVEGIRSQPGSVDAVTEAGAGGRIAEILEAVDHTADPEQELEEAVLKAKQRKSLPTVSFAIPDKKAYPIQDEAHARNALARVAQHGSEEEKKQVRAAVKRRYPNINLQEEQHPPDAGDNAEGGDVVSELLEALRDPESEVAQAVNELVESRVEEARESGEAEIEEAKAEAKRSVQLRDFRDEAHKQIEEADLPEKMSNKLLSEYDLIEGDPTDKLDVVDKVDDDGEVTEPALTQLQESVKADIEEQREVLADLNPTQVRGQGPSGSDAERKPKPKSKSFWREHLEEAGVDPDAAFDDVDASEDDE